MAVLSALGAAVTACASSVRKCSIGDRNMQCGKVECGRMECDVVAGDGYP